MKVLVGQLILDQRPELADGLRSVGSLESFDPWMMTSEVVATIARFRPDVVLVHRLMLDMSFLLRDYLRQGSCPDARVVIGSHPVTNVDKIETAHAGFADVVDLGPIRSRCVVGYWPWPTDTQPWTTIRSGVRSVARPVSTTFNWSRATRPTKKSCV